MKKAQQQVKHFMLKAGQECPPTPSVPAKEICELRCALHYEEAITEFTEAFQEKSLVKIADAIADSLVVILGTANACGINIEPIFNEVMRSNMTKFIDGHLREDGKWIKGPSYSPAQLQPLIKAQQ